ncbi:MAG: hypothetical protein EBX52_08020, partial [Proteobacteria bacterium]|nr:hypothetical protein [Pseudomonadota bacterium]
EALEYRIVNALFDGNTSIPYSHGIPGFGSAGVRVSRNIYNNYDVMNTWTVIDTFQLQVTPQSIQAQSDLQLWDRTPEQIIKFPVGSIGLGVNGTLELRDIRQMSPEKARTTEAPDLREEPPESGDIQDLNPYLNSSPLDSPMRVKLKDILNVVKLPFKIPFHARGVKKHMRRGEIISYTVSGTIGFGANVGWNLSPIPKLDISAGIGVEVHVNGSYQVAILKEDDRFVKVRVSRLKGVGTSGNLSTGMRSPDLYEGFLLFKGSKIETRVASFSPSITPFRFSIGASEDHGIDVGYRYDLDSEEGREAYHRAVLGSFAKSDEVSTEETGTPRPAVEKLYRRTTDRLSTGLDFSGNINPVFRFSLDRNTQNITTEIELPDGTKKFFQSSKSRSNMFDFFGNGQKTTHRTSILIDHDAFREKIEDSFLLMSENSIEDSYTTAPSLNTHFERVETDLGQKGIFPRFPAVGPLESNGRRRKKLFYGRSSFYFGMTFKLSGLRRFLETTWETIEERAGKLGLHLSRKHFEEARDAFGAGDAKAEYQALTRFFSNQRHSELYPLLLMEGMPNELFERFLVAQNPAFGNIQVRGHTPLAMENTLRVSSQSMGMGTETERVALDPEATIRGLGTTRDEKGRTVVHLNLTKVPEFVYFRMQPMSRRHKRDVVEIIAYNRNQRFKEGENLILLDPESTDPLAKKLSSKLLSDETLFLTVGYSRKGSQWGFGASTRFATTSSYPFAPALEEN